ncbi:MAG: helix-turn-helix domain-containing protein [Candidatus Aegiribacteria sp.]|nr:helix-turn-helix domain-containing protein [Candidatus Aegiribacteria sp.]
MNELSISDKLRERRRECGLSLSELARLADTSPATLSRYENGWTRFEVATLRKLASALNCRLKIEFVPAEEFDRTRITKSEVIDDLKRLFWESEFNSEVLDRYPVWAVKRVLESGQLKDIHSLQILMGRDIFLESVLKSTRLSTKTQGFWNLILKKEGMSCMKKSSRQTAWNS